ncbi:MAG TPA: hypothetical protein VF189_01840 [Patescibacteria group bacterium]
MLKSKIIALFVWGIILWLIGYILGIIFFMFIPQSLIGWIILPFGIAITLYVLIKKIKTTNFNYYLLLAFVWTIIAILLDYIFIVKFLKPTDGYYKFDVYIYYLLTFMLPIIVGFCKRKVNTSKQ